MKRPQWVPVPEAAAVVGCSVSSIRNWYRTEQIGHRTRPSTRGSDQVLVSLAEVRRRFSGREDVLLDADHETEDLEDRLLAVMLRSADDLRAALAEVEDVVAELEAIRMQRRGRPSRR